MAAGGGWGVSMIESGVRDLGQWVQLQNILTLTIRALDFCDSACHDDSECGHGLPTQNDFTDHGGCSFVLTSSFAAA